MIAILALLLGMFVVVYGIENQGPQRRLCRKGRSHRARRVVRHDRRRAFHRHRADGADGPPAVPPGGDGSGDGCSRDSGSDRAPPAAQVHTRSLVPACASGRDVSREHLRGHPSHGPRRPRGRPLLFVATRSTSALAVRMDMGFRNSNAGSPMKPGGKVSDCARRRSTPRQRLGTAQTSYGDGNPERFAVLTRLRWEVV